MEGVVGVVDADFGHLTGRLPADPDVIVTEVHDLEMILLQSNALERVLRNKGSDLKRRQAETRWGQGTRQMLLGIATRVGALRLYSERHSLSWRFEGLEFGKFLDVATLALDQEALCQEVKNKSIQPGLDILEMSTALDATLAEGHDSRQLCCGHDVVEALRYGLRRALGTQSPSVLGTVKLGDELALAYDEAEFSASQLAADLKAWEARRSFLVLTGP
jgi:Protein of unknown function (DUF4435)